MSRFERSLNQRCFFSFIVGDLDSLFFTDEARVSGLTLASTMVVVARLRCSGPAGEDECVSLVKSVVALVEARRVLALPTIESWGLK